MRGQVREQVREISGGWNVSFRGRRQKYRRFFAFCSGVCIKYIDRKGIIKYSKPISIVDVKSCSENWQSHTYGYMLVEREEG